MQPTSTLPSAETEGGTRTGETERMSLKCLAWVEQELEGRRSRPGSITEHELEQKREKWATSSTWNRLGGGTRTGEPPATTTPM